MILLIATVIIAIALLPLALGVIEAIVNEFCEQAVAALAVIGSIVVIIIAISLN